MSLHHIVVGACAAHGLNKKDGTTINGVEKASLTYFHIFHKLIVQSMLATSFIMKTPFAFILVLLVDYISNSNP